MTRTLAEENKCHVKCVQCWKLTLLKHLIKSVMFMKICKNFHVLHVWNRFRHTYRLFYVLYQFKKEVYDWFDLKGFAVLCMTRELDEWWKTTPDLVPTVHFGIHRITLWNVRPYRTTVFRPVSFLPFNGCNLF